MVEHDKPPIPFPQRLAKVNLEAKFGKFQEVLKNLHTNIPFLGATSKMPSYVKFLKYMLSNKRKFQENEMVSITEECTAILQNMLPLKLNDPSSFSIPCDVGDITISRALYNFGVSVSLMPYSI